MSLFKIQSVTGLTPLALWLLAAQGAAFAQQPGLEPDTSAEELTEIVLPDAVDDELPDLADDDLGEAPDLLTTQPLSADDRLRNLFKLYRDAVNDRMFAEADTLAKQIVELSIEMHGLDSEETARAITNLAIAQHGAKDYVSAELNFTAAIDITERISDRLNEALINPLKGLAAAQLALGKPAVAADTFERAMHISHVNFGPHNLEQIEVLESLAETLLVGGDYKKAIGLQERIFALQARNIDANSEQLLPALVKHARWLHRLRLFDRERYTWRRMIGILEKSRGKDDVSLIEPLTELGNSYLYVSIEETEYSVPASALSGEIYLKRAIRIAEKQADVDWDSHARTMISLGDYYLMTNRAARAERMYRNAWEIYSKDESRLAQRVENLQSLPIINTISVPEFYGDRPRAVPVPGKGEFERGTLTFEYTVTVRGTATDIELIEAEPAGLDDMERSVARELRRIIHRPRMVDERLRSTDNVRLTHNFFYRPDDLTEAPESDDESSSE